VPLESPLVVIIAYMLYSLVSANPIGIEKEMYE